MDGTLPFERGATFYGVTPDPTAAGAALAGQEYVVKDTIHGTGRMVTLRVVKNTSGFTVLAKRRVLLNALGSEILGYTRLPEEPGPYVDQLLPTAGCLDDDLCYVVVKGPALGLSSLSNYSADVAAGVKLNGQTAVTSGATTAGRIDARAVVAATADATAGERNSTENDGVSAKAISACLTSSTNADVLVDVDYLLG